MCDDSVRGLTLFGNDLTILVRGRYRINFLIQFNPQSGGLRTFFQPFLPTSDFGSGALTLKAVFKIILFVENDFVLIVDVAESDRKTRVLNSGHLEILCNIYTLLVWSADANDISHRYIGESN